MSPTHLGLVHEAGQEPVKGGVINVTKVKKIFFIFLEFSPHGSVPH